MSEIEIHRYAVDDADQSKRLDVFLQEREESMSRTRVKELIEEHRVTVNGSPRKVSARLKAGDEVTIRIPPPAPVETAAQDIPLAILFEDPYLIVIDKPQGMVVHPAAGNPDGTLVNALLHHCKDLSGIAGLLRPGIVHRLDKDTSGVLVAAKTDAVHRNLQRQFKIHSVSREYWALARGQFLMDFGTERSALGRHPRDRMRFASVSRGGKEAVTHWYVIERFDDFAFLKVHLETGRTHQIRVHLSEKGNPILGDPLYGGSRARGRGLHPEIEKAVLALSGQALHAHLLGFRHPMTGAELEFKSPPPEDFQEVLEAGRIFKGKNP